MTRALIAEDEPLLAQALQAQLARVWPELEIAAIAPNGPEALRLIELEKPDIAFLDIRMPGMTGLEVAAELADRRADGDAVPRIVFVTAYDEFALKAFDLAAVDYLLKPVTIERLARAIDRLRPATAPAAPAPDVASLVAQLRAVMGAQGDAPAAPATTLTTIRAAVGNTVHMVPVESVCYFQATDKYTSVITADAELLIRTPLKELLPQLPHERFRQIHRGTIVNMGEVVSAVRDEQGRVSVRLKHRTETLGVSRVFADLFRQM
ncbi:MAG: response regulator transcription factor [Burkholderiales bacterium]|nr:response regulator transcription factor [Burkholderiales bacterium]